MSILEMLRVPIIPRSLERFVIRKCRAICQSRAHGALKSKPTIWVDVSVIVNSDAKTGIQRVVRALSTTLISIEQSSFTIKFIAATKKSGYREVKWVNRSPQILQQEIIIDQIKSGDFFFGLDLAAHILPSQVDLLMDWKKRGVRFYFIIYDLIPYSNPKWFSRKLVKSFRKWLRVVAVFSDGVFCISEKTRKDFIDHTSNDLGLDSLIPAYTIRLSGDIDGSLPTKGLPKDFDQFQKNIIDKKSTLLVGTIEPRKGHDLLLDAYDILWKNDPSQVLILVGRSGWKTEKLQKKILNHQNYGRTLYWFDSASDELLEKLYAISDGVVVPSLSEGFGLPIIEALKYYKPLLVRDISVFREFKSSYITYFSGLAKEQLADEIIAWQLASSSLNRQIERDEICVTWSDTVGEILQVFRSNCALVNGNDLD